jgi:hypothetical protein
MLKDSQRGWLRIWLVLVIGFSQFFFYAEPAWACKCTPSPSPSSALNLADAVFTGTVVAVIDPTKLSYYDKLVWSYLKRYPSADYQNFYLQLVVFKVTTSWKGITDTFVTVRAPSHSAGCGYTFTSGQSYLVYSHNWRGKPWTNHCTRTTEFNHATEDLHYLQTVPALVIAPLGLTAAILKISLVILILLAVVGMFWIIRRNRLARRGLVSSSGAE